MTAISTVILRHLRTEYLDNPLGLDTPRPRFSWQLAARRPDARGLRQRAYQVQVFADLAPAGTQPAVLWDSGEVESSASTDVEYAGPPLASRARLRWRVRVREHLGAWSDWSGFATWTMGLLRTSDWTARWIGDGTSFAGPSSAADNGRPPPDNTLPDPWFRRRFHLSSSPVRTTAFVASVGYHELYVNGRKAGSGVLQPNLSDHSKRARYVAYEIGDLLRAGDNVLCLWLGAGWSIFPHFASSDKPRAPIVIGQFDIELPGGGHERIVTDDSWKTHPSPNTLLGVWHFQNFGGELYDATRDTPEWAQAGQDDSAWRPATVYHPALVLSADAIEPNRCVTPVRPVAITPHGPGVYRIELERNFAGWFELDLRGEPGDRIELQFSERADRPMTNRIRSAYIIGAGGGGTFRNRFNYMVGQWVTVSGLRQPPSLADARAWLVRNDYQRASSFECSNPLLQRIHDTALWTFENLTVGGYVADCPHRERMGYGGDAHATTTMGLCAFHLGAFYTKWTQDWRDVQDKGPAWGPAEPRSGQPSRQPVAEPGNLPYSAPTYWGGGGPAWSGICVHLPWELYRYYGDRRILEENFATIVRWIAFLEEKVTDGLLRRWGGEWDFLGDWLWPDAQGVNGDTEETLFFNNCYRIYNLQTAAQIARAVDRPSQANTWDQLAVEARARVHARFYRADAQTYINGSQSGLAIALAAGVPPASESSAVWRRLEHEIRHVRHGHFHVGITGGAFLLKVLVENDRSDLVHVMAGQTGHPGFGHMLAQGATTFWEFWSDREGSLLHSSYLWIGAWFTQSLLGIRPDPSVAGFHRFLIRPDPVTDPALEWARGHFECRHGRIWVAWQRTDQALELCVEIPANTVAEVFVPSAEDTPVSESGREVGSVPGLRVLGRTGNSLRCELGSGSYRFNSTLQAEAIPTRPSAGIR